MSASAKGESSAASTRHHTGHGVCAQRLHRSYAADCDSGAFAHAFYGNCTDRNAVRHACGQPVGDSCRQPIGLRGCIDSAGRDCVREVE